VTGSGWASDTSGPSLCLSAEDLGLTGPPHQRRDRSREGRLPGPYELPTSPGASTGRLVRQVLRAGLRY
jgi:hypothetical protein